MDLIEIKKELSAFDSVDYTITIHTDAEVLQAGELLKLVDNNIKIITEKRKAITDPIRESLSNIMDLFSPYEKRFKEMKDKIREEMAKYQAEKMRKEEEEKKKIEEKVNAGKLKPETAVSKLEKIETDKKTFTENSTFVTKKLKEVVIEDASLIPREYLIPDMPKIKEAVLYGKGVPGCKIVEKVIVATK